MIISDTSVKNKASVFVVVVLIIIMGTSSYIDLPREATPDVKIPYVFVSTGYTGVAPKDIETAITIPIEEKLKGLKNVKEIRSSSSEGNSSISIEFVTGTEIDDAVQWVKDKVDTAKRELPSDLEDDPSVFEINLSEMPIMALGIKAPMGLRQLKEFAEDLKDDIEAIPGVLEVDLVGGLEREIHIEVDPDLLAVYGIPFNVLYSVVSGENQNVSGGNIAMGDGRYQIRVPGEFKNVEDFKNLIVTTVEDSPVYLRDIAVIKDSFKDITSKSKLNFKDSINLYIKKRVGENIIYITDAVKALIDEQEPSFPAGLDITVVMDQSNMIRFMLEDLENNIITGFLLVLLVLMFAMGFRNALLASIAIPLSMALSFSILYFMDITLNMVTLFSLILALGMLVDNAIVIVENIYRFTSQGVPRAQAAMRATGEVAWPVIASTATTVAAFIPLLYWGGLMGEFMKYLPITLITTLSSSLFVAMVINPTFCSVFVKTRSDGHGKTEQEIIDAGEKPLQGGGWIIRSYDWVLRVSLKNRLAVLLSAVLLLVLLTSTWILRTGIERPVEFFPSIDPESCYINIDPPEGMDMAALESIATEVQDRLQRWENVPERFREDIARPPELSKHAVKKWQKFMKEEGLQDEERISDLQNVRFAYTRLSTHIGSRMFAGAGLSNHIGVQFYDFEGRPEKSASTMERIRSRIKGIAGAEIFIAEQEHGPPTGKPINIEISGDDFDVLGQIAEKVKWVVSQVPFVEDVEDTFVKGAPTIELIVDRKRAAMFGITTGLIGTTIKTAINGWNVSTYREGDEDYDIFVRVTDAYRKDVDILRKLFLPTPRGLVPLSDLVTINYIGGLGTINRIDHRRVVTVMADVDENKMPGAVARMIATKMLRRFELPAGYSVQFTGEQTEQADAEAFLKKAFMIALSLVFIVLVIQFNSVFNAGIIMFSVILSLGGIFLGLAVADIPFGIIMTGIGVISLAGVVVNNAIVLLDYTNHLLQRGYNLTDSVINAARTRFRPVMLTAITTILGLLPMITGVTYDFKNWQLVTESQSQQWWFSMAIAVAFGLAVATVLTLVVVPTIFHLVTDMKYRFQRLMKKSIKG